MKSSICILKEKREETVERLRTETNKEILLLLKKDLDKAISWLEKIEELEWNNPSKYNIEELPDMQTGYSEYRIMNDCETDNQEHWIELEMETRPTMGDFLLISKPQ